MSLATAPRYAPAFDEPPALETSSGVQALLQPKAPRPNFVARGGAAAAYLLALAAVVTYGFKPQDITAEEQNAIELAPVPTDEQPEEPPPVPAEPDETEPPPLAPEAIEPLPDVKPPPPKPTPKPRAEPRAAPRPAGPRVDAPAVRAPPAKPDVPTSAIANFFHACMARAAANAYPESQAPRTARVGYHATFSASGALVSFSITPSGNGAFDAVASRLGGRCGSLPAPGRPVSLSGALTFRP